ncbi:MAG TPA: type II 3-dehydroquinate dehydratase [Saprospiraceae bacterium]|nr:type II 3-dehydroquinate dehydratase [Saprospiraceae bacterium]
MKIAIVNGPNLNMLGMRETHIYGTESLNDIQSNLQNQFPTIAFDFFQSNHEGSLIDYIQMIPNETNGLIINPGAYTHSSIALRDALSLLKIPIIEVHISNIYSREEFRKNSFIKPLCVCSIVGMGTEGYSVAVSRLKEICEKN